MGFVALFISGTGQPRKEQDTTCRDRDVNKEDEEDGVEREDDDGTVE